GDPFRPAAEAARLAEAPPDPLLSRFTPTYSMALNLLRRCSIDQADHLLRRSFGQFLADARRPPGMPAPSLYAQTFHQLAAVLAERGYLRAGRPTEAGHLAAALRTENELLVAEIARSGTLDDLSGSGLAAVVAALAGASEGGRVGEREGGRERGTRHTGRSL